MSFSGTPLGSGRRLDHHTFLNGGQPSLTRPSHSTSAYTYAAPELPILQRNPSPTRSSTSTSPDRRTPSYNKPPSQLHPSAPGVFTSPPKPTYKDTSVNIATAFHQAAAAEMPNSSSSWNAQLKPPSRIRATSDRDAPQTNGSHKPPSASGQSHLRAPTSATESVVHVSDSEEEETIDDNSNEIEEVDTKGRPLSKGASSNAIRTNLSRALSPAAFYVRERSRDPEGSTHSLDVQRPASRPVSRESSYDYSSEQIHYEELLAKAKARRAASQEPTPDTSLENTASTSKPPKKSRNRISVDNQAWKPGKDDADEDEDYDSDSGKKRRRKKKKDEGAGRLTNLPTVEYGKKRKSRKSRGRNPETIEEEVDEESYGNDTSELIPDDVSIPPLSQARQPSVPLKEEKQVPHPDMLFTPSENPVREKSFPLASEIKIQVNHATRKRSRSRSLPREPARSRTLFSPGAVLGTILRFLTVSTAKLLAFLLRSLVFLIKTPLGLLIILALSGAALYYAGFTLPEVHIPFSFPSYSQPYHAPSIPASTVEELVARLTHVENALSDITHKYLVSQNQLDREQKLTSQQANRISLLEGRLDTESRRQSDTIETIRSATSQAIMGLKDEVTSLKDLTPQIPHPAPVDTKLESTVHELHDRVGLAETTVKDVLEYVKSIGKSSQVRDGVSSTPGWLTKLRSGQSPLTIRTPDGQDITALISSLVDESVARFSKDVVAKPDFALYTAGGRVVPSITSPTFELRPSSWLKYVSGLPFGYGFARGRPPVTALHADLSLGSCWPFSGSQGQLAIVLARSVFISEFTVDHASPEIAFDIRSAPKDFEVWGFVEGRDNLGKYAAYKNATALRREQETRFAEEHGTEPPDPEPVFNGARRGSTFMHLTSFMYDVHVSQHIQTFTIPAEIQDLGIDFGIVVFRILSNWGHADFTCLYRARVHGIDKDRQAPLFPPQPEESL